MILQLLLSLVYWAVPIVIGLFTGLVIYARWHYGTLEKTKGLTGIVKPYFVGGSDPFFYKKIVLEEDSKNARKYGPIFGFYEGREPQIFISDPDLIRLIFIKDFDHFSNKRDRKFHHPLISEMMDVLPYEKWKTVRSFFSPQLTTGKIKSMSYQMLDAINEWSEKLHTKANPNATFQFIPKQVFTALTTDVIARCAFGTKIDPFDQNNVFVRHLDSFSMEGKDMPAMLSVFQSFPFLMGMLPIMPQDVMDYFKTLLSNILNSRRKATSEKINDFVDVMNDMMQKCSSKEYKSLQITEDTVMAQAMIFLIAGLETTASTLTILSYWLSKNVQIQEKLIQEVDSYLKLHDGKIEHETITELVYMTACMNETLRLNSPLGRVERVCVKDWVHEPKGLHIKKGMVVQVPIYAVHHNEKYFPDPLEFKPERFLPENKDKMNPYAFLPFGLGPHNCIGMRFVKEEILMTMASILKDYRIEGCEDSKLKLLAGRAFLNNYEPFHLKISKRSK